jgi:hypothetical protein
MEQQPIQRTTPAHEEPGAESFLAEGKQPWQEPKLTFIEPKLTHHGTVQEVTGQSFGTFPPTPERGSL